MVAVTENVYVVPAVNPETVIVPDPLCDTVPVKPPGLEVAVYRVISDPPLDGGAVNGTDAEVVSSVTDATLTVPTVGEPGTVTTTTLFDAADTVEVPMALVAVTVNV